MLLIPLVQIGLLGTLLESKQALSYSRCCWWMLAFEIPLGGIDAVSSVLTNRLY